MANRGLAKAVHRVMRRIGQLTDGQATLDDIDWDDGNFYNVSVTIRPNAGLYKGGRFKFLVTFTEGSSYESRPALWCETPIYHPNITVFGGRERSDPTDTNICLPDLQDGWHPTHGLEGIAIGLLFLLHNPNTEDPLNSDIHGSISPDTFAENVKQYMATGTVGDLDYNTDFRYSDGKFYDLSDNSNKEDGLKSDVIDGVKSDANDGLKSDAIDGVKSDAMNGATSDATDGATSDAIDGVKSDAINGAKSDAIDGLKYDAIDGAKSDAVDTSTEGSTQAELGIVVKPTVQEADIYTGTSIGHRKVGAASSIDNDNEDDESTRELQSQLGDLVLETVNAEKSENSDTDFMELNLPMQHDSGYNHVDDDDDDELQPVQFDIDEICVEQEGDYSNFIVLFGSNTGDHTHETVVGEHADERSLPDQNASTEKLITDLGSGDGNDFPREAIGDEMSGADNDINAGDPFQNSWESGTISTSNIHSIGNITMPNSASTTDISASAMVHMCLSRSVSVN